LLLPPVLKILEYAPDASQIAKKSVNAQSKLSFIILVEAIIIASFVPFCC
jgi:hypothetical protein